MRNKVKPKTSWLKGLMFLVKATCWYIFTRPYEEAMSKVFKAEENGQS